MGPLVLSLCDHSGVWSGPYAGAGYEVVRVDIRDGDDIRLIPKPRSRVRGILAAPPCTHFARVGAPHWGRKGDAAILEGLAIVDACLRQVALCRPDWWALENPIGRLKKYLGEPAFRFDPCDFAGLAVDPEGEAYTKRTWLWGHFTPPTPLTSGRVADVEPRWYGAKVGSRDRTSMLPSRNREARSVTPSGFARAFFLANP